MKERNYDFERIKTYSDKIKCLTADMEAQGTNYAKSKAENRSLNKEISDLKRKNSKLSTEKNECEANYNCLNERRLAELSGYAEVSEVEKQ